MLQSIEATLQYLKRASRRKVARSSPLFIPISVILVSFALPSPIFAQTAVKRATKQATKRATSQTQDPGAHVSGRAPTFADEFDGATLNYSKWSPHPPGKLVLSGRQEWLPEAVDISGGQAHIIARKTQTGYTSGIITTFGTFARTYGRFEIRFRMPAGRGLEPLFRLLPVPSGDTPSIDIMNATGSDPAKALFANRWTDGRVDRDYTGSYKVADLSAGFHVIAVEWDEEKIVWIVDGVERFQSFDGVPHQPMYLAVCLAVASEQAGEPDAQTGFPALLDIDYVRVFARP